VFTALHTRRFNIRADCYSYSVNKFHKPGRFIPIVFLILYPFPIFPSPPLISEFTSEPSNYTGHKQFCNRCPDSISDSDSTSFIHPKEVQIGREREAFSLLHQDSSRKYAGQIQTPYLLFVCSVPHQKSLKHPTIHPSTFHS
jgi:hypothetical protein